MENEYEPMDVDLSNNSIHPMDISYSETDCVMPVYKNLSSDEVNIKSEYTDTVNNESHETSSAPTVIKRFSLKIPPRKDTSFLSNTMLSIAIVTLSLVSLLIYQASFKCSKEFNLDLLKETMSKNLFGQTQAIEDVISSLDDKAKTKILILYGGTGVGKTFMVSFILENILQYANIYHYTMPSFVETHATDLMVGLTLCPSSVIVVDNLNRADMHIEEYIKKLVEKSVYLQKNITIILVYNCDTINDQYIKKCDNSFYLELQQAFREINAFKRVIKFHSLTEEHLRKCVEKELGTIRLSEEEYKNIIKNLNVTTDGCKGVYKEIKMFNIA